MDEKTRKAAERYFPFVQLERRDLRAILHDTLGPPTAIVRTMIRPDFVDDLLAKRVFADRNWAQIAYAFLILELWFQEFGS